MFNGDKKKKDDGVIVLSSTKPYECGGKDATLDTKAPKTIKSNKMALFSVTSALNMTLCDGKPRNEALGFVSAFAAPCGEGTFLYLETSRSFARHDERDSAWALVAGDIFPTLVDIVNKFDLARENGYHSVTHGLPQNFGGSIDIRYDGGEKISVSDNQGPIISNAAAEAIKAAFDKVMSGEKVSLPSVDEIDKICYDAERKTGFTRAKLTIRTDGTAVNEKEANYGERTYKSVKDVGEKTVAEIKKIIARTGLLAWEHLPEKEYRIDGDKTLTFVLRGGGKITVRNDVVVPQEIGDGFFKIELEMATKH